MQVGRARAQSGHNLALQPCLRSPLLPGPSLILFKPRHGKRLLPRAPGPQVPPPFSLLLVPTPLPPTPPSVRGKNAVSSEWGPRVTGGGSPSCMAPGVRDPLLRPRLPCLHPASASAHPAQSLTTAPGRLLGSRGNTDGHQVAPLCSRYLSPLSQLALASRPDKRRTPTA